MSDLIATIPSAAITVPSINALHAAASTLADEARAKATSATQMALLIGLKLTALKAATPHGQWEKHFKGSERRVGKKANDAHVQHLDFSQDTARRYIAVAAEIVNRRLTSEQSQALAQIVVSDTIGPAEQELLEEVTPAETLRQLYLQMGIVKPTKREALAMAGPPPEEKPAPEEKEEKPATSLAERISGKKSEARTFWFGTNKGGSCTKDSLFTLLSYEQRSGKTGRLANLPKDDLVSLSDLLKDLHTLTTELIKIK